MSEDEETLIRKAAEKKEKKLGTWIRECAVSESRKVIAKTKVK